MIALDLFAGTGWGVACRRLGIEEYGVEIMPEARAVRALNGMHTLYGDVWTGLLNAPEWRTGEAAEASREAAGMTAGEILLSYDLLIASPPCQTFSMAGGGAGRKALDEVLEAIDRRLYLDPAELVAFGERHDPKTALVLAPLAHIARDVPTYVVLEQVPPVLPVWERYAEEMRRWGYSVWTGNLQAEMYGVPQTRKRAILIARADGVEAKAPTPTHSRYYSRDPQRLDEGVEPWVSMAEALGWDSHARHASEDEEALVVSTGNNSYDIGPGPERERIKGTPEWRNVSHAYERATVEPAPTLDAKVGGAWKIHKPGGRVMRSNYGTGGDPAARGERSSDEPAPTATSKADRNQWQEERPATTVAGDSRVWPPGHKVNATDRARHADADERYGDRAGTNATRVTIAEAAILQSYPADFRWDAEITDERGRTKPITKTNTFLQIGNAVPPGLAEAILREVLS